MTVQKIYTACLEKQKSSQIKSISWNVKSLFVGRRSKAFVIIGQAGPFGEAKQALECMKAWELFFSDDIMKTVVTHTNNCIKKVRESFKSSSKTLFTFTCDVDEIEMRAFIGLVYIRGLSRLNNHDTEVLYNPVMGPQSFGATMSKNRLEFLYSCVSFDDFQTRSQRWSNERFAAIRDLFEIFCGNCSS